ncbi:MAG TPA: DMT family transporter [Candidatus Acidoferrales bacterium]|nr:DMT family transporter [Candidatus Acidoferrales bacterium]
MNNRVKADAALALCTLVWGATFVLVKNALADASVLAFLAVRFIAATVLMALIFRQALARTTRAEILAGAWIGVFMFGGYVFQTVGLFYTTPSKAAFITGSSVVLVPIFHGIFWRTRIGVWIWLGAAAALAGLYLLTVPASGLGQLNRGDLIASGCTVMFALHILFVGHFSPKHSPGGLAFYQIAMTALLAAIAVPLASAMRWERLRFHATPELWLAIFITAAFATAFAFSVQVWAQQHTTPTHTAILFSLEPVFAAITSLLVLGERLTGRALGGAAMIMAGIVATEMLGGKPVAADSVE